MINEVMTLIQVIFMKAFQATQAVISGGFWDYLQPIRKTAGKTQGWK